MSMRYNPDIHHRHSIRLSEYDYSQRGAYFVTICTQNRECLFGNIVDDEMLLNDAGEMVKRWFKETKNKYVDILPCEYVIMPNHFHAIIVNAPVNPVGADLCFGPNVDGNPRVERVPIGADLRVCLNHNGNPNGEHVKQGEHIGSPLHRVVQWFKTMTTNEYIRNVKQYNWQPFDKRLWQRNYYEHIIRDESAYIRIAEYISTNPQRWENDTLWSK